jgi:hypothetical protein
MTRQTRISPNRTDVAAKVIEGEAILINLTTGMYYSSDGAGGMIWQLIETSRTIEEIADAVSAHYAVEPDRALADIQALAADLVAAGLVHVGDDAAPAEERPVAPLPDQRGPYQQPRLVGYDDMAQLLALDPPHPALASALSKPVVEG